MNNKPSWLKTSFWIVQDWPREPWYIRESIGPGNVSSWYEMPSITRKDAERRLALANRRLGKKAQKAVR